MSTARLVLAIDGPSGSGKSTVAALLSKKLDLQLLDTGAMYRCVGMLALEAGTDLEDEAACASLAQIHPIRFEPGDPQRVFLGDREVTQAIRTLEVGQAASRCSVHPAVRRALVAQQKTMVLEGRWVLEGRDIGTVVVPDATLKVFLTASIEERARRRWLEVQAKGDGVRLQEVVLDVVHRDHRDYTRDDSPLQLAEDAVIVETYGKSPDEVVEEVSLLLRSSGAGG